jgi:hypothetical protein
MWQESGALSAVCSDGSTGTLPITGNATFAIGVTSDLVLSTSTCGAIRFDLVSSTTASIQRGQSCTAQTTDATATFRYTTYTFTTTDGRTGTSTINETLDIVGTTAAGMSGSCTLSGNATATRL